MRSRTIKELAKLDCSLIAIVVSLRYTSSWHPLFSSMWSFFCQFPSFLLVVSYTHASFLGCNTQKGVFSMSTEQNKALTRRFRLEVFSQGNIAAIDEICDANWTYHDPDPQGNWPRGPQGMRQLVNLYRSALPDLHFTIEDEVAEGDKVVTRWTARGTHKGELMGIPPTGRQATVTGITINRMANGKIVEDWVNFDALGMMQQLGVIPAPGQAS